NYTYGVSNSPHPTRIELPDGSVFTFTLDTNFPAKPTVIENPLGFLFTSVLDSVSGMLLSVTNPLSFITSYTWLDGLLETVAFPFDGEKKNSHSFRERKAETVIETARQLSRFCDIYKAEFPGHIGRESDVQLQENMRKLDAACERPWVLLSAGVDFPEYKRQVEMALKAGASGVLGGRAFWKEYFQHDGVIAREQFARQEAQGRVRQIDELVQQYGKPWYTRYGLGLEQLQQMRATENWHFRYGASPADRGYAAGPSEGEVY
ncbi:MAG: hypothetical protein L0Z62_25220, partial [Gemmataceae bacterium]|nr:hypothetical protein [Gemmataceae bacterium]